MTISFSFQPDFKIVWCSFVHELLFEAAETLTSAALKDYGTGGLAHDSEGRRGPIQRLRGGRRSKGECASCSLVTSQICSTDLIGVGGAGCTLRRTRRT